MNPQNVRLLCPRRCAPDARLGVARGQVVAHPRAWRRIQNFAGPAQRMSAALAILCAWLAGVACTGPPTAWGAEPQQAAAESLPASLWTRSSGEDWPSFLGPNRNGKSSETGLLIDWPPAGPRVVWTRNIGKGYGAGSISRGRYYHFDRAGDRARLFCLNAETGAELWVFEYLTRFVDADSYDNGPRCSPVVDGNRVYIYGAEGMLFCLRADDGTVVWSCDTVRQFGVLPFFFGVGSTPVVEQNLLIAIVGGSPAEDQNIPQGQLDRATGNGTGIVAFDKFTGEVEYSLTRELASYAYADQYLINLEERGKLRFIKATPKKFELAAEFLLRDLKAPLPPAAGEAAPGTNAPQTPAEEYPPPLLKFPCWAAPILSHGLLYLQGRRRLVCVELISQGQ
ncbi:MAG: outer membrane protein assembly factor BamB family protein [Pirellulaceae bacterium]